MRPLVSEHLPEILGRILHTDLVHRRLVRDVIHRPWREVLKAALMVHRVPKHLSKVHHRTDDAAIGRSGKHVRTAIDDGRRIFWREPILTHRLRYRSAN